MKLAPPTGMDVDGETNRFNLDGQAYIMAKHKVGL